MQQNAVTLRCNVFVNKLKAMKHMSDTCEEDTIKEKWSWLFRSYSVVA